MSGCRLPAISVSPAAFCLCVFSSLKIKSKIWTETLIAQGPALAEESETERTCHLGKLAAGAEPSQTGCALPLWHWQAAAAVALVLYRWTLDCTSTCRNCSVIVVLRRLYRSTLHFSIPVRFEIFKKNKCIFNDDITSSSCLFSFYFLLKIQQAHYYRYII